ncbi:MAG: kelch repeat-containing protein, partial [Chitinophagales bacterium]
NIWTQKADFGGTASALGVGFNVGSKGYLATGVTFNGYTRDFWEYDPDANIWTQKADFDGTTRSGAVGFSIGNKGYVGTGVGNTGTYFKDFWEYDPDADTWTQKADFAGTSRGGAVGLSIGSKGYLGTGIYIDSANHYYNDFWEYNPAANTWTQKSDFGGTARYGAVGFSIGSKGYLGTGFNNSNFKKDFWEYDPDANTWMQKANFGGTARESAACLASAAKDMWEWEMTPLDSRKISGNIIRMLTHGPQKRISVELTAFLP